MNRRVNDGSATGIKTELVKYNYRPRRAEKIYFGSQGSLWPVPLRSSTSVDNTVLASR